MRPFPWIPQSAVRSDLIWREDFGLAVGWYVESLSGEGNVETALVLLQAALELVASVLIVEDKSLTSLKEFDNGRASEKLRKLLRVVGVPRQIPPPLRELSEESGRQCWENGPHAFTEMRNGVVHARKIDRLLATTLETRRHTKNLGLWYLELALLSIGNIRAVHCRSRYPRVPDSCPIINLMPTSPPPTAAQEVVTVGQIVVRPGVDGQADATC